MRVADALSRGQRQALERAAAPVDPRQADLEERGWRFRPAGGGRVAAENPRRGTAMYADSLDELVEWMSWRGARRKEQQA